MKLRISSRQSELARYQAYRVGEALENLNLGIKVEYLFRESLGDKNLTDPLWKMPEKGVFTEDFYQDLVLEQTDMVVHSWKDLPTEEKPETFITATLKRADQRDLLLFKKDSVGKREIKIFSSSPRRAHNLTDFLKSALPFAASNPKGVENLSFESVRGNIQTRVRKWLESQDTDGLILAKAAFDRLLIGEFEETKLFLQSVLKDQLWMALPLRFNPNAAAQGALAIEVKRSRKDLIEILSKINCPASFKAAENERQILRSFGGGCHLALGMSCLSREYGDIEIVKGLTPSGEKVEIQKFTAKKKLSKEILRTRLEFKAERENLPIPDVKAFNALYVAKVEAYTLVEKFEGVIWTSGIETWKKLAAKGVWVNGSNESMGEEEDTQIIHFVSDKLNWGRLTHSSANTEGNKAHLPAYNIKLKVVSDKLPSAPAAFLWMSPVEFDAATEKFPDIKSHYHICGPGRTYEALKNKLGSDDKLFIELFN